MTSKLHRFVRLNPVLSVLILSGLAGFCLGLSNATWQAPAMTGQVLAGIVKYPIDNPFYMYHISVFSVINQISALMLRLGCSEKGVSVIISALLGMISFQAIAVFIFAINRNVYIAILGVVFIYFGNYIGRGVIYPIDLLGRSGTYGILGLSFIALVIALFGAEAYRLGLFCLGLAPCVHPSLGVWPFIIMFLSALFQPDFAKRVLRANYRYFIAGLLISISSLIYQLYLMQDLPVIDPEIKKQMLNSFIKYWDEHRRKFYWVFTAEATGFKGWGVIFCIYSVVAGFLGLRFFKKKSSLSFLFIAIIISGILSLLLGFFTYIPPERVPACLLVFMPGRYINLNNIISGALFLGILTSGSNAPLIANYKIFIFFLISSFFSRHIEVHTVSFAVILVWFTYLTLKVNSSSQKKIPFATRVHKISYEKLLLIFMALFLLLNLPREKFVNRYITRRSDFKDRTNNEFYAKISERKGLMAVTSYSYLISLKTARPVLADMAAPNFFTYAPESAVSFDNILKKVYGIDLLVPPLENYRHQQISSDLYRELWEKRTVRQWQDIRKEFGVTDVLTRADWKLSLPVVAGNEKMVLYEIPDM